MSAIIIRKLFCSKRDCDKLLRNYLKLRKLLKISKLKYNKAGKAYSCERMALKGLKIRRDH